MKLKSLILGAAATVLAVTGTVTTAQSLPTAASGHLG